MPKVTWRKNNIYIPIPGETPQSTWMHTQTTVIIYVFTTVIQTTVQELLYTKETKVPSCYGNCIRHTETFFLCQKYVMYIIPV